MFGIKDVGHTNVLEAHFDVIPLSVVHEHGSDVLKGYIGRAVSLGFKEP